MQFRYRITQIILFLSDISLFFAALWVALFIRFSVTPGGDLFVRHMEIFTPVFLLWAVCAYINSLYDLRTFHEEAFIRRIAETAGASIVLGTMFFYLAPQHTASPKTILVLTALLSFLFLGIIRTLAKRILAAHQSKVPMLFVGFSGEVQEIISICTRMTASEFLPTAIVHSIPQRNAVPTEVTWYTDPNKIRAAVTAHNIRLIVVESQLKNDPVVMRELSELLFWPVRVIDAAVLFEHLTGRIPPSVFHETWFLEHLRADDRPVYTKFRRLLDALAILILLPIIAIFGPFIALCIRLSSPGPIFIRQLRIGRTGKPFTMYKFRSMYALSSDGSAETVGAQFAVRGDIRITFFGKFLRVTRLDELPQLLNLMRGDVTLIGPRPERPQIVNSLSAQMPHYRLRHMVTPGLTGWAAIHQHYTDTMETSLQKLEYDLYYIKNRGVLLDLSILLKTIQVIVKLKGQ